MTDDFHTPVLVEVVLSFLQPTQDVGYVDATLGGGGHAERILKASSPSGRLIAFDADGDALEYGKKRLAEFSDRMIYVHDNFSNIRKSLNELNIRNIKGILLDLGVSSRQLDDVARGFSFQRTHRLDMRMDRRSAFDARQVVNSYPVERLAGILSKYGEEKHSKKIARRIIDVRAGQPIETTGQLSNIVESVVGKRFLKKSLARVFQAIRIEVNDELNNLQAALRESLDVMNPGGRLVVISYHSLEDRIVKDFFREQSITSVPSGHKYLPDRPVSPRLRVLTKKPVVAGETEIQQNPRARSAKLRAAEKLP